MALRDDWALSSAEVERWLSELNDDEFEVVGAFIQWMLARDAVLDDRVIVALPVEEGHLGALLVPRDDETWALTFYLSEARWVILLTVYQLVGEGHPDEQVRRAVNAMERAKAAGDDPSVLVPGR